MSRADFISMTTSGIAGTNGNGAVTMSQITSPVNMPTFTQVFGSGTRVIDYTIIDSVGGNWEKGFGSVSGNVLTRLVVHETYNGTTYVSAGASALAFGSTPAAGNITIRLAPTVDAFDPITPAIQTTIGSDTYQGYQFTAHYMADGNPGQSGNFATATEYYFPFKSIVRGAVGAVAAQVQTAGASGGSVKLALYEVGQDGLPGPCITQFNTIAVTATGFIVDSAPSSWAVNAGPIRLSPGWFYIGMMTNDTTWLVGAFSGQEVIDYPPTGRNGGYGFGTVLQKTAQNSYAAGLPTGTPSQSGGAYSTKNRAQIGVPAFLLRITN